MFQIDAQKAKLTVKNREILVSGAQNIYVCQFTFNSDWLNVIPTIVFRTDHIKVSVLPDQEGRCRIPWEVLEKPLQDLQVGVYGTQNGQLVLPTIWISLGQILPGTTLGEDAQAPATDVYDQILATAARAEEIAQSVREDADNGFFGGSGEGGIKGDPATLIRQEVSYLASASGTVCPSGEWSGTIPEVPQGQYLWTKTVLAFNTGKPVISYSIARMGLDGINGSTVSSVNSVPPNENGNVVLTAETVGALPSSGGSMTGVINMQGQTITGLKDPTSDTDAAPKKYVDTSKAGTMAHVNTFIRPNLLDNWYWKNPVNQREISGSVSTPGYFIDRWKLVSGTVTLTEAGLILNGTMVQILEFPVGQETTASVLTSTGLVDGSYDAAAKTFTITATGEIIIAAKLELGSTQTLAHQDAEGNWVLNEIPDYREQLVRCKRFATVLQDLAILNGHVSGGGTNFMLSIPLSVPLRTDPVVTSNAKFTIRGIGGYFTNASYGDPKAPNSMNAIFYGENVNLLGLTLVYNSGNATNNTPITATIMSGRVLLSADL